ncbi:MAG: DnaD domain protein [Clostridia bacterium]|nr:DnaD domain protein [Clostridia bacterium]MBR6640795.1 DnaD domain protein [Clostridia bacterium]
MKFVEKLNREVMDVELPGIFVNNCMTSLDELSLKLYIYIKFLAKNNMEFARADIAKKLGVKVAELEKAFDTLEAEELVIKTVDGFDILDVKEQELNKIYIPKLEPKVTKVKSDVEKKRIAAANAINESFFQGIMALCWFVDINTLFEKYGFEEEVMIALFHDCAERRALNKNYVFKVAESWYKGGVKTFADLEDYLNEQDKLQQVKTKIKSKLRLNRAFTEYEEIYISEWINKYGYTFDEIDYAIKKTVSKGNASIGYINGILTNWHENGYKTLAEIIEAEGTVTKQKIATETQKASQSKTLKHKNYEQDKAIDWNQYYDNM